MRSAAIVINWNSWLDLECCLKALVKQSLPFSRILVIDNDSSDPMPESLCRWLPANSIEFIAMPENVGFARANNVGLKVLHDCSWVALVNPDAFLEPSWHEQMICASELYHSVAGFSSALVMANDRAKWDGLGDVFHMSGLVWRNSHGRSVDEMYKKNIFVFSPCAAAAFYRLGPILEIGGFDEDYFCYLEDVDLGFRLRLRGYDSMLVSDALAYHVGSATTGGKSSDFAVYHGHRNIVWTFVKNMPSRLFLLFLPLHILMNLSTIVLFTLRGQGKVILKAKWDAIKGLPHVIRKRKAVQSTRRCSVADIWRMLDKRLFIWNR